MGGVPKRRPTATLIVLSLILIDNEQWLRYEEKYVVGTQLPDLSDAAYLHWVFCPSLLQPKFNFRLNNLSWNPSYNQ